MVAVAVWAFSIIVDGCGVLDRGADVVEALQQNYFPRWRDFEFEHQTVFVGDGLVRQIHG